MKPKLEQGLARTREWQRGRKREREKKREGRREKRQAGREGEEEGESEKRCVAVQLARASCGREATRKEERAMGDGAAAPTGDVKFFLFLFFPSSFSSQEGRKRN